MDSSGCRGRSKGVKQSRMTQQESGTKTNIFVALSAAVVAEGVGG